MNLTNKNQTNKDNNETSTDKLTGNTNNLTNVNNNINDEVNPSTSTLSENQNTTFAEERAISSMIGTNVTPINTNLNSIHIGDHSWNISQAFAKPQLLQTYTWDTTHSSVNILTTQNLFHDIFSKASIWKNIAQSFEYFRFKYITFRIQINATKFNSGQSILFLNPFSQYSNSYPNSALVTNRKTWTYYSMLNFPHVKIKANQNTVAELRIPYIMPCEYIPFNQANLYSRMGSVEHVIQNPLRAGTNGPTNVTCTMWVKFEGMEVHLPRRPGGLTDKIVPSGLDIEYDIAGNYEYPPDYKAVMEPNQNCLDPVQTPAHGSGNFQGDRISVHQKSSHKTPSSQTNLSNEMDFKKIITKYSLLNSFTITTTQNANTVLLRIPVTPQVSPIFSTTVNGTANTRVRSPTFLDYIARTHTLWSGDIKYKIEVVASDFATMRLQAGFTKSVAANATLTYDDPLAILDIQESKEFEIIVPFYSATSTKRILKSNNDLNNNDNIRSGDESYITGQLILEVLNTLRVPQSAPQIVDVNVYIAGADNMEFYYPTFSTYNYSSTFTPSIQDKIVPSGLDLISERTTNPPIVLGNKHQLTVPPYVGGEKSTFMGCIKRFTIAKEHNTGAATPGPIQLFGSPIYENTNFLRVATNAEMRDNSYLRSSVSYFSMLFALWHGTLRYQFISPSPRTSDQHLRVYYYPSVIEPPTGLDNSGSKTMNSGAAPFSITTLSQSNGKSFEIPYISEFFSSLVTNDVSVATTTLAQAKMIPVTTGSVFLCLRDKTTLSDIPFYNINMAAGDDFTLQVLVPPPLTYLVTGDAVLPFTVNSDY